MGVEYEEDVVIMMVFKDEGGDARVLVRDRARDHETKTITKTGLLLSYSYISKYTS